MTGWFKTTNSALEANQATFPGGCFTRGVTTNKGKYQILDPHNLSIRKKLTFLDMPKTANDKANGKYGNVFYSQVLTCYGGLKVSEFKFN